MKHVMSISVDEKTIYNIREKLRNSNFRSKSHLIEQAIIEFLRGESDES